MATCRRDDVSTKRSKTSALQAPVHDVTHHITTRLSLQVGLAVVNGQLMAIGGFDGSTYLKTVEIYNAETNSWQLNGGMNYRRLGGGVGVIRLHQHEVHLW